MVHILDDLEGLINKIIGKTGWHSDKVKEEIKKKQDEYGGLLTEAGAAYSIAKEMGALDTAIAYPKTVPQKIEPEKKELRIKDLGEGMLSVDIKAEVLQVFPARTFSQNGKIKNVVNVVVKDETADTRLALWDRDELVSKIKPGSKIEIINAYTKKNDFSGKYELNVSYRGDVKVLEAPKQEVVETPAKTVKLSELSADMSDINVTAKIVSVLPIKEFESKGRKGKVSSLEISDGYDTKRLVLWNEHADLAGRLKPNDLIKVESAYVKDNNGTLEVHLGRRGELIIEQAAAS